MVWAQNTRNLCEDRSWTWSLRVPFNPGYSKDGLKFLMHLLLINQTGIEKIEWKSVVNRIDGK